MGLGPLPSFRRRLGYLPMAWNGVIGLQLGIGLLILQFTGHADHSSAIFIFAPTVYSSYVWPILIGVGGAVALAGCLNQKPYLEAAGLALLAFCWFYDAVAILSVRPFTQAYVAGSGLLGLAGGIWLRFRLILDAAERAKSWDR